ncbi:hypothetical protein [Rubinisphaera brasiliensis]|uniref:hypothetical protein n=1 Tax=Rubinisphaera brasiliensis TaxID=119 RepID=UPI0001E71F88|nr:hypothetical protein [Rubinisphaera brasiliensis]
MKPSHVLNLKVHGAIAIHFQFKASDFAAPVQRLCVDSLRKFEDDAVLGFFSIGAVISQYGTNNVEERFAFTVASSHQIIAYMFHVCWVASPEFPFEEPGCLIMSQSFSRDVCVRPS